MSPNEVVFGCFVTVCLMICIIVGILAWERVEKERIGK